MNNKEAGGRKSVGGRRVIKNTSEQGSLSWCLRLMVVKVYHFCQVFFCNETANYGEFFFDNFATLVQFCDRGFDNCKEIVLRNIQEVFKKCEIFYQRSSDIVYRDHECQRTNANTRIEAQIRWKVLENFSKSSSIYLEMFSMTYSVHCTLYSNEKFQVTSL